MAPYPLAITAWMDNFITWPTHISPPKKYTEIILEYYSIPATNTSILFTYTEYVWLCSRLRMLGRLAVKLFWWLLSRGWLPDSILRKCCVHQHIDLDIDFKLLLTFGSYSDFFCFFSLLSWKLISFALVSPDSLLLLLSPASLGN